MEHLPVDQIIMMFLGVAALMLTNANNCGLCSERTQQHEKNTTIAPINTPATIPPAQSAQNWATMLLLSACVFSSLLTFVCAVTVLGSVLFSLYGAGDTRYVAKKFAAYHICALSLLVSRVAIPLTPTLSCAFLVIAFGILTAVYPFNSWLDSFFLRTPHNLAVTWLVVIRPLLLAYFFKEINKYPLPHCRSLCYYLGMITIFFVPILFFARKELRRLASCLTCWQSGYIWLFTYHLPADMITNVTLMAIAQGIMLSVVTQVAILLHKHKKMDSMENLSGLFEENYFCATFFMTSLCCLLFTPVVFAFKKTMPSLPNAFVITIISSLFLPSWFINRIYRLMSKTK